MMRTIISVFSLILIIICSGCQTNQTISPTISVTNTSTAYPSSTLEKLPTITQTLQPTQPHEPTNLVVFYSNSYGNPDIFSFNLETGDWNQLTDDPTVDDSPAISPDGSKIVFLTARHDPTPRFPNLKYEIYTIDIYGDKLQRLTNTEAEEDHPTWSPDGVKILFDTDYDEDGYYEIYDMSLDGTQLTRLTSNAANDQFADWSPDGQHIAFSSDRNGNWDIFIMDADGNNQIQLTDSSDWELFPAWSPDGSLIAFNKLIPRSRNTHVCVMNADGSQTQQLTNSPTFDENPVWSPDGSQIAFQTDRDGNFEIYIMNADGSNQILLFENPSDELWPSWRLNSP